MDQQGKYRAYIALGAVCFFWGTTYLGIRVSLESLTPMALMALRYLLSGAILLGAAAAARVHIPAGRDLLLTSLYGVVTIGLGTGALVFAEEWVPSGLASVFITTSPFWMAGVDAALPGGERLRLPTMLGMLTGLAGTLVLVSRDAFGHGGKLGILRGFALLQFGCAGWALGSILQRRHPTKAHPVVSGGVQQLATGLAFSVPALLFQRQPIHWTTRSILAVGWLVIFGGVVGYSAFIYSMDRLPVSIASIYTYVNPVVAVTLGWLFFREPFGVREAIGMAVIFVGVALVKRFGGAKRTEQGRGSTA